MDPMPQRFGRYDILLELGRGGMAELFLARRSAVGGFEKLVAIKRVHPHLTDDPQFRELFLNEARIAAQLSHPNVCAVHELDESDGELFLAMEYLEGVSWDTLIAAAPRGEIAMRLSAAIIAQAAEGLHYAHTLRDATGQPISIVHRDVSPSNIFVTVDGVVKVLDFGIAKMAKEGPKTRTGVLKGKLPYMAPEQIEGKAIDGRTDLFALGVCLWEALTGERLYERDTDFLIWKAITEEPVPSVNARVQRYPAAIDGVIQRALEKDKALRYANVREFSEALSRVVFPMTDGEIAGLVRSLCADRIAKRQREVAAVVSESREASRELRAMTGGPPSHDPGSTTNLRGPSDSAAATVPRSSEMTPPPVAAPETQPSATMSMGLRGDSLVMPRPRRRWPYVVAALAAVLVIVIAVIVATRETALSNASSGGGSAGPVTDEHEPADPEGDDPVPEVQLGPNGITVDDGRYRIDLGKGAGGGISIGKSGGAKPVKKPAKDVEQVGSGAR